MSAMEPSALALFWVAVIGVAILAYVILDGFDLGVGILFGATKDSTLRDEMIASISPFWDGNETWLIVVGASLFAAFPVVYAVFLAAFYIPVLLLLLALIFRGVAFEFRARGAARGLWDRGFVLGSARGRLRTGRRGRRHDPRNTHRERPIFRAHVRLGHAAFDRVWSRPRARLRAAGRRLARPQIRGRQAARLGARAHTATRYFRRRDPVFCNRHCIR